MNSFGRILEKHLKSHGYKKKDLAAQLEVTEAYISIICHGTQPPPTYDRCQKIADFLDLPQAERIALYKAAIESRAKKDIQIFLEQISILSTQLDEDDTQGVYEKGIMYLNETKERQIPLLKYPKENPCRPFLQSQISEQLLISCIVNDNFYAIQVHDNSSVELGFKKRDIVIINPEFSISNNDLVLVKLDTHVSLKRVYLFSIGEVNHIEFLPSLSDQRIIFKQSSQDYEIFGKVVHSVLSYT